MKSRLFSTVLIVVACLFSAAVSASVPSDVQDLVGQKAHNADPQLERRGYVHIESQKSGSHSSWGMWWNPSSRECASVAYEHGKVRAITSSPAMDCNQTSHHTSGDDDSSAGAALAVGAAAILIGALAMSHKSQHHENGSHSSDQSSENEFERGHRDGLHNKSFNNYNGAAAYSEGYQSGVNQRNHNTSYPDHSGQANSRCPSGLKGNECEYYKDGYAAGAEDGKASMSNFYGRHEDGYDSRFEPYFARGYEAGWEANR